MAPLMQRFGQCARAGLVLAISTTLGGCIDNPSPSAANARARASHDAAEPTPRFVAAPADGAVHEIVRAQMAEAKADSERVVVYVGASWCEPCTRFHRALEAGELEDRLEGVRFLEFDVDRDRGRLAQAGYSSRLIPLFAVPGPDGRGSDQKIEGGVKGDRAVDHILARLEPLLDRASAD